MPYTPREIARVAALAADEKKAEDIVLLDLSEVADICDFFLIATATNKRLADAVVEEIEEKLRLRCSEKPLSIEGRAEGTWILLDYGAVVIHVMTPEARDFYRLENLWGEAPRIDLNPEDTQ